MPSFHVVLGLICVSSVAAADITVEVPKQLAAWERAGVKVTVRNTTGKPIVPLSIALASDAGTLATWGVDGSEVRWGNSTPARRRGSTWEVLLGGPPPQQMMTPPDSLSRDATEQLIQLDPIPAGATVELSTPFVAMYQHGGKLAVTMTYTVVDPKSVALCTAAMPAQKAFVVCKPVSQLGGTLYASHPDLVKAQQKLAATAAFAVSHPPFDLADARTKTKVATGGYGYDRSTKKWILVDGARTVTIDAGGATEDLPGDWLHQLVGFDSPSSTYWNATAADAAQVSKRVTADKLSITPFNFKGKTSNDRFMVTFSRRDVPVLAAAMRALGYRMTEFGITKN